MSQEEFGTLAFEVMRRVFEIRQEFGRFFEEKIYKRELARRLPGVALEVPVDVIFQSFSKRYFLDAVYQESALFEFKMAEAIVARHRAQTLHYLFVGGLGHAKLVNLRPEVVEHEFVNTTLRPEDRLRFSIQIDRWNAAVPGAQRVEEVLVALLRDFGVGLELSLYEEAITHFLGGEADVLQEVEIVSAGTSLGHQRLRLCAPSVAFKLTALPDHLEVFEDQARRLLQHTRLDALLWINLTLERVTFTTIQ
ncbi:hypothetical protein LBMAG56_10740 [Verrucomicrobiota bacterium]|nr:hypothetical protein LBMAG56_10740 [Verrucomicrobiota bacterium]